NGQVLKAGSYYTATGVPVNHNVFDSWTGSATSSNASITFQVPVSATNFSLTAKFILDPLQQLAGTYHGLFQSLGQPSLDGAGFMNLSLGTDGLFSGSALYHGVTYYFTGRFDSAGNATITGIMDGQSRSITLQLQ